MAIHTNYVIHTDDVGTISYGNDGHTPIKGVDYFDGVDGLDGSDASVTKVNVEAVLTGEISSHSHAGGITQAQIRRLI
jgi:hypothetical protein